MTKENPTIIVIDEEGVVVATLAEGVVWDRPSRKFKVKPGKPPVVDPPPPPPPVEPPPPPPVEPPPPEPPIVVLPPPPIDPSTIPPPTFIHLPKTDAELRDAINAVRPGEAIHLDPSIRYVGNFTFPGKDGIVTLRTAGDMSGSRPGVRVRLADAPRLAKVQTPNSGPAFMFGARSGNWLVSGVQPLTSSAAHTYNAIQIGDLDGAGALSELPDNIVIERCIIPGDPVLGGRRGVLVMGTRIAVRDSWIGGFWSTGSDSQAVGIFGGLGPFLIENNFLEGAGENLFLSAEGPLQSIPENIVIRRNHLKKRLEWMQPDTGLVIKNLFEIKSARHVLAEANVLENNPIAGQSGYGVLFTARTGPIPEISDVRFRHNKLINVANGFNVLGKNGEGNPGDLGRVFDLVIEDNLIEGAVGRFLMLLNGIENITVRNNTALGVTESVWLSDGPMGGRIDFLNNAIRRGWYGIHHSGTREGADSIAAFWKAADVSGNVFVGPDASGQYPAGNTFVPDAAAVPAGVGADMAALEAAIAGVVQ